MKTLQATTLLIGTLPTILAACGSPVTTASISPIPSESSAPASTPRLASPPSAPTENASPSAAPSGVLIYANKAGQFTFSAPAEWQIQSCEDNGGYAIAAESGMPPCGRGEYSDAWFMVQALIGDQRQSLPPTGGNNFYAGTLTSTTKVTVDGVDGNRYTAVVDKDLPLPPPRGTTQVYCVFYNSSRTYAFVYDRFPTDPDRSVDFDRVVQQVKFSA